RVGLRRGALDDQGRDRRGGAGARAERGAVRALQLARRGGFCGQAAVGDALRVRRPRREARRSLTPLLSPPAPVLGGGGPGVRGRDRVKASPLTPGPSPP